MSNETNGHARPVSQLRGYVQDVPNLVTLLGLLLGFGALIEATRDRLGTALALALIAILVDNLDGALARRDSGRTPIMRSFGAHLDCFADFVSKGLFPPLLLIAVLGDGVVAPIIGGVYLLAIALRYSWELGTDWPARGLSPDYAIAVFAAIHLARGILGSALGWWLAASMLVLAVLALAPFRVPKLGGWALRGFMALLIALAVALLATG